MNDDSVENDIIVIDYDVYDEAFAKWVISVYGKSFDEKGLMNKFDIYVGLSHCAPSSYSNEDGYNFKLIDKKKFFLAKIKYGF